MDTKLNEQKLIAMTDLTGSIVSAFVSNNIMPPEKLPGLIEATFKAIAGLGMPDPPPKRRAPIDPEKAIEQDFITSLEDGQRYRSLRRHLTARGMTPEQYREKWGLRPDYPMVAPSYSVARSALARKTGLGRRKA